MADYRGGGLTNMKIREAEKLVENIRHNVEQKKKEAEGGVSKSKLEFRSSNKIKRTFLIQFLSQRLYFRHMLFLYLNVSVIWFHFLLFNDTLIGCIFVLPVYFTRVFFLVQF